MNIRYATKQDIPVIMDIYKNAREFMRKNGNPTQWGSGNPKQEQIEKGIKRNEFYVCIEDEKIAGVFAFIIGPDPTYGVIEQGDWHYDMTYGTIHRIASDGCTRGITKACFDFCSSKINYLRIDTHADNKPMQTAVTKYGFKKCGIIHVADGTERIAFDYLKV